MIISLEYISLFQTHGSIKQQTQIQHQYKKYKTKKKKYEDTGPIIAAKMMQLKGLNHYRLIVQYMNRISAKFDFEKVKQNKVRALLVKTV